MTNEWRAGHRSAEARRCIILLDALLDEETIEVLRGATNDVPGKEEARELLRLLVDRLTWIAAGLTSKEARCVLCGNPSPRLDPAGVCAACRMPAEVPPPAE
jgi:hypothetical protein